MIVVMKTGTTMSEYNDFVKNMPDDPKSERWTQPWDRHWLYYGNMDSCLIDDLEDSRIALSWTENLPIVTFEGTGVASTEVSDELLNGETKRQSESPPAYNNDTGSAANEQDEKPEDLENQHRGQTDDDSAARHKRALAAHKNYSMQRNSPTHLQWLSSQAFQDRNTASTYHLPHHIYDDGQLRGFEQPTIYVIDTFFEQNHMVCLSPLPLY